MKNINANSGSSKPTSRAFRSNSFAFTSLVFVPNTTRCNIQSIYTADQIAPVLPSMTTIQVCVTTVDVQVPTRIKISPTKPFSRGKPIDASEVTTKNVENQGIGRASPPKSAIMRV